MDHPIKKIPNILLLLLLITPTTTGQKTDPVYLVGVPFDIDGDVQQVPVTVHAGQSPEQAVQHFCRVDHGPRLCGRDTSNVAAITSQILTIVKNTIASQRERLYPNIVLQEILEAKKVKDATGKIVRLDSNVAPDEGLYLYNLIKQNNMTRTLEVGMAFGVSTLYIAQAHYDLGHSESVLPNGNADDTSSQRSHYAIDPFQSTQWKSIGSFNLMRANLRALVQLIEQESHFALPQLAMHEKETFQLCFIDGMHLFDYTLIDFYYSDLIVEGNGYIVFDDAHMPSVQKVIAHALKNRAYVQIDNGLNNQRVVTLQKQRSDNRRWDYHVDF